MIVQAAEEVHFSARQSVSVCWVDIHLTWGCCFLSGSRGDAFESHWDQGASPGSRWLGGGTVCGSSGLPVQLWHEQVWRGGTAVHALHQYRWVLWSLTASLVSLGPSLTASLVSLCPSLTASLVSLCPSSINIGESCGYWLLHLYPCVHHWLLHLYPCVHPPSI